MSDPHADRAFAFLRAHTTGDLRFEEHLRPLKYVISPEGRLVASVMVAMLRTLDTVLYVPEVGEEALELQVTLEALDEQGSHGHLTDRWRIHHGDPEDVRWAFLDLDAARFEGMIIDGISLIRDNPLAGCESALCRDFNQTRADELRALCRHFAHIGVEAPVMVGADPLGVDVRGRFDVIRVASSRPMADEREARAVLQEMIETAGSEVAPSSDG